jgi:hypothetical protein
MAIKSYQPIINKEVTHFVVCLVQLRKSQNNQPFTKVIGEGREKNKLKITRNFSATLRGVTHGLSSYEYAGFSEKG